MSDYEKNQKTKLIQEQLEFNRSRIDATEAKIEQGSRWFSGITVPCALLSVFSCNPRFFEQAQAHDMRLVLAITVVITLVVHTIDKVLLFRNITKLTINQIGLQGELVKCVFKDKCVFRGELNDYK